MAGVEELHQDIGALKAQMTTLTNEMSDLKDEVKSLTAVLNQARGAKWAIFVLPALVSGVVAVAAYLGLKLTFGSPIP